MGTSGVARPGLIPEELSGANTLRTAPTRARQEQTPRAPTGISNINVQSGEGKATVQQGQLDLGLAMTAVDGALIANLGSEATGQLMQLATTAAGLTAPGSNVANTDLQGRWSDFISQQGVGDAMDVNSLVQFVLREAYMENTKDLHFYAQKVRFYNELKKSVRNELTSAREFLAKQAGTNPEDALKEGPYSNSSGGTGPLQFPTEPQMEDGAMVPHAPTSHSDLELNTKEDLTTYIQNLEEQLNSIGDDAQLANVDLQNMLQKQQQTLQSMSNISKMLHDTAMAIIRKIGS